MLSEELDRLREEAAQDTPNNSTLPDNFRRRKERENQEAHIIQTQRMLVNIQRLDQEQSLNLDATNGDKKRKCVDGLTNKSKRLKTYDDHLSEEDVDSSGADENATTVDLAQGDERSPILNNPSRNLVDGESVLGSPEFSSTHKGTVKNSPVLSKEVPIFKYAASNSDDDDTIFDF